MKAILFAIALVIFAQAVHADIGPSPEAPRISVTFMEDGQPYKGEIIALYRCWDVLPSDEGPLGQTDVQLSCDAGVCTNTQWFYKFNPCYFPSNGEIIFQLPDREPMKAEGELGFPEPRGYAVSVDIGKGQAWVQGPAAEGAEDSAAACPLGMALLAGLVCATWIRTCD